MREATALVRAHWLTTTSYRLRTVLSFGALLVGVVPLYFISHALQPVIAESIRAEGGEYFGFLVVGLITYAFLRVAVNTLPSQLGSGIRTGTLEALFSTRASLPSLLGGLVGFDFLWTAVRMAILLLAAWVLGAGVAWDSVLPAILVVGLIVATYLPFGLVAAALVLAFRTSYPLPQIVLYVSALLGGVYYPTHVVPDWLEQVTQWVPLTYGLRALRRVLLEGQGLAAVAGDVAILAATGAALLLAGWLALRAALAHARRTGSLVQY